MEKDRGTRGTGLDRHRLEAALNLVRREVESGFLPAVSAAVYFHGERVATLCAGHCDPETKRRPVHAASPFLVASLTKPVVCAAAMLLVEEGRFTLEEPACRYVPELAEGGKEGILIRHLFTHTSGLPDQLPEGTELRKRHAARAEFVRAVCDCEPLFAPGSSIHYQSMGILILAEIVERVAGMSIGEILAKRLFAPLGMDRSVLGMPAGGIGSTVLVLPPAFEPSTPDYGSDWNTEYWRAFGAPWGGLHSTAEDLGRFLMHMLGERPGPLSVATRSEMPTNQTDAMLGIPETQRAAQRWGLGWMLHPRCFGSLVSRETFGHVGATGTLYWADPASSLATVLLTSQPRAYRDEANPGRDLFGGFSNALAASLT